jgi:hypothetical protein
VRGTRSTYVALLAVAVVGLVLPSFVVAGDEMPLERDELPKVSQDRCPTCCQVPAEASAAAP